MTVYLLITINYEYDRRTHTVIADKGNAKQHFKAAIDEFIGTDGFFTFDEDGNCTTDGFDVFNFTYDKEDGLNMMWEISNENETIYAVQMFSREVK